MKLKLLFIFIFVALTSYSQQDAWVYFNDKPNAMIFIENPLSMLTQKSLDRRIAQNISIDFKDVPIHQAYIDQITAANGIVIMAKSKWLNCLHIRGSVSNINALASLSFVTNVKFADKLLNTNLRTTNQNIDNTINKNSETQIIFNYGNSNNQIQMLNGHLLHQQNFTGTGKTIAVLDSGFIGVDTAQPFARLQTNNLILGGYNYVSRNTNFYSGNNHGTMVLSTMGGYTENQLVGTAPDAKYYLFVTEDVTSENPVEESLWVEAAEEADRLGVDIINTSLGYFDYNNPNYSHTFQDMNGVTTFISCGANIAFSRGILVVVSAGNSGASVNPHIASPADATNVLTVGAVDSNGNYASFSSVGPSFDNRVKPDIMAKGKLATVAFPNGTIGQVDGTSLSSPIIAGMVACLWQALPNKSASQIMQIIKSSSNNYSSPNANYGYGIPNFLSAINNNLNILDIDINKIIIEPNPTSDYINFCFSEDTKNCQISIFNTLGQEVCNVVNNNLTAKIYLGNQQSGFYFYKIKSEKSVKSGKIIKN